MSYAIIRGANGRRHEVDFGENPVSVSVHPGKENFELFIEADSNELPESQHRFAIVNIPIHVFNRAMAEAAKNRILKEV